MQRHAMRAVVPHEAGTGLRVTEEQPNGPTLGVDAQPHAPALNAHGRGQRLLDLTLPHIRGACSRGGRVRTLRAAGPGAWVNVIGRAAPQW